MMRRSLARGWQQGSAIAARAATRTLRLERASPESVSGWIHGSSDAGLRLAATSLRVRRASTTSSSAPFGPDTTLEQLAAQLCDPATVSAAVDADQSQVVHAIGRIAIQDGSTDDREEQAQKIVQAGALDALLDVLRDGTLSGLHISAFLSLIKLSAEGVITRELLRIHAQDVIASYSMHADPRLQAAASLMLGNLAVDAAAARSGALATSVVVDALLHVLRSPHEAIQRTAVTTLASIAGGNKGREALCQHEPLVALCDLLVGDHSDALRGAASFALGSILSDHEAAAQDLVRETGALPQLVLLMSPAYEDEVCSSAAWAIHHAVRMNHENQELVSDAGALGLIFPHAFSDNETLQTNALLALESSILGHEGNLQSTRSNTKAVELLCTLQRDSEREDSLNVTAKRVLASLVDQLS